MEWALHSGRNGIQSFHSGRNGMTIPFQLYYNGPGHFTLSGLQQLKYISSNTDVWLFNEHHIFFCGYFPLEDNLQFFPGLLVQWRFWSFLSHFNLHFGGMKIKVGQLSKYNLTSYLASHQLISPEFCNKIHGNFCLPSQFLGNWIFSFSELDIKAYLKTQQIETISPDSQKTCIYIY